MKKAPFGFGGLHCSTEWTGLQDTGALGKRGGRWTVDSGKKNWYDKYIEGLYKNINIKERNQEKPSNNRKSN